MDKNHLSPVDNGTSIQKKDDRRSTSSELTKVIFSCYICTANRKIVAQKMAANKYVGDSVEENAQDYIIKNLSHGLETVFSTIDRNEYM